VFLGLGGPFLQVSFIGYSGCSNCHFLQPQRSKLKLRKELHPLGITDLVLGLDFDPRQGEWRYASVFSHPLVQSPLIYFTAPVCSPTGRIGLSAATSTWPAPRSRSQRIFRSAAERDFMTTNTVRIPATHNHRSMPCNRGRVLRDGSPGRVMGVDAGVRVPAQGTAT
jgi:hypothetical protein